MQRSRQAEITEPTLLLDDRGHLLKPGYAKHNYFRYNKEVIAKHRGRIKEWDYYMISDGRYMTELNFFNISFVAALTATVIDLKTGKQYNDCVIEPSRPDKFAMSSAADAPFHFAYSKHGRHADFICADSAHTLSFEGKSRGKKFTIDICATGLADQESLTTATPFEKPHCFFYTQKLNCMQAAGTVRVGELEIHYDPAITSMVMDWGRGIWPRKNTWYWSNGSSFVDGKPFGFEITWGFGKEEAATQTALFYDGKCHKIAEVRLEEDPEQKGWMCPWHFIDSDGRLDLTLTPQYHRNNGLVFLGLVGMKSHQVFGNFCGHVVLDDGTPLEIKSLPAFAEKVYNCW